MFRFFAALFVVLGISSVSSAMGIKAKFFNDPNAPGSNGVCFLDYDGDDDVLLLSSDFFECLLMSKQRPGTPQISWEGNINLAKYDPSHGIFDRTYGTCNLNNRYGTAKQCALDAARTGRVGEFWGDLRHEIFWTVEGQNRLVVLRNKTRPNKRLACIRFIETEKNGNRAEVVGPRVDLRRIDPADHSVFYDAISENCAAESFVPYGKELCGPTETGYKIYYLVRVVKDNNMWQHGTQGQETQVTCYRDPVFRVDYNRNTCGTGSSHDFNVRVDGEDFPFNGVDCDRGFTQDFKSQKDLACNINVRGCSQFLGGSFEVSCDGKTTQKGEFLCPEDLEPELTIDRNDCVGFSFFTPEMDVIVRLGGQEILRTDASCARPYDRTVTSPAGVRCRVQSLMCASRFDFGNMEVRCENGKRTNERFPCPSRVASVSPDPLAPVATYVEDPVTSSDLEKADKLGETLQDDPAFQLEVQKVLNALQK